jgi:raffinose/stachyose/melibiose transport system substrate-binding protein
MLGLAAGVPGLISLAACTGTSGPGGSDGGASYWFLSGQPQEGVRMGAVDRFNEENPDQKIMVSTYENDPYKTRIKTAIGANQAPTIIWGWGGGTLGDYVANDKVEDLTSWFNENPEVRDRLLQTSFTPATINNKIYAMPCETAEPIVLYYNKEMFADLRLEEPSSWEEMMALVPRIKAAGKEAFALAGQSKWTSMMWLEFLFDRIGGPEVFEAAYNGETDAWSDPAALDALQKAQDLVKAGGFARGFESTVADQNADQALLHQGRAAMMLHGSWSFGIQQADGGDFVSSGKLGYINFPPVEGGKGDRSSTVGNPAQYLSISSNASTEQKEVAKKFFATHVLDDTEVTEWIGTGGVPILTGIEDKVSSAENADFVQFIHKTATEASVFAQSWDQALPPAAATPLLDNIAGLFGQSISPQQFADNMNKVTNK